MDDQTIVAERHETIGRGHAERLVPWIADLPGGGRADRIIVGCGPGSFTGVRIGIAAARGLGLGWGLPVFGVGSLALIAIQFDVPVTIAIDGGHGEVFVQNFTDPATADAPALSLPLDQAARHASSSLVAGNAAETLVEARGSGEAIDACPRAVLAVKMTGFIAPVPIYGRGADARPMVA